MESKENKEQQEEYIEPIEIETKKKFNRISIGDICLESTELDMDELVWAVVDLLKEKDFENIRKYLGFYKAKKIHGGNYLG